MSDKTYEILLDTIIISSRCGKKVEWGELGGRAKLLYGHECFYLSQLEFGRMVCSPLVDSLKLDSKTYFSTIL